MPRVCIPLTPEQHRNLRSIARSEGITMTALLLQMVNRGLGKGSSERSPKAERGRK